MIRANKIIEAYNSVANAYIQVVNLINFLTSYREINTQFRVWIKERVREASSG